MATEDLAKDNHDAFQRMMADFKKGLLGPGPATLKDIYMLKSDKPEFGKRYFVAKCKKCHQMTTIIEDVSDGTLTGFVGDGGISSECCHCGESTDSHATEITSAKWDSM